MSQESTPTDGARPSTQGDIQLLRKVVARELDTISEYEHFADAAQDETLQAFFRHLADEEKEHVAEAFALIAERDAKQKHFVDSVDIRHEHFQGAPRMSEATAQSDDTPAPADKSQSGTSVPHRVKAQASAFTVGSLKQKPIKIRQ